MSGVDTPFDLHHYNMEFKVTRVKHVQQHGTQNSEKYNTQQSTYDIYIRTYKAKRKKATAVGQKWSGRVVPAWDSQPSFAQACLFFLASGEK